MEFETTAVGQLDILFKLLKRYNGIDQPFKFTSDGIRLASMVGNGSGMIVWEFNASDFMLGTYLCNRPVDVLIDIDHIAIGINNSKNWDSISMRIDPIVHPNELIVTLNKHKARQCGIPLLEAEEGTELANQDPVGTGVWKYSDYIIMPSQELKTTITELNTASVSALTINYDPKGSLTISGKATMKISDKWTPSKDVVFFSENQDQPPFAPQTYGLSLFKHMIKITKAAQYARIYPTNGNCPLRVDYELNGIGKMQFFFAPRIAE